MSTVGVTDHAVVKWLEHVAGIDVASIRRRILEEITHAALAASAAGLPPRYSVRTGDAVYVLKSGTVVTVLAPGHVAPTRGLRRRG